MRDAARAPLGHPVVVHLTVAERVALGRAARSRLARSSHAAFDPPASRPDPVELLESQAADRVPSLLPIRYGRMVGSPFGFFRGAAVIMAGDLAASPDTGLRVQLCGDAHLSNFGVFASPERRLVFDLNDFDETSPGPFEWDVKRLAASLAVAGRENGFSPKDRRMVAGDAVAGYRQAMRRFARLPTLDVWYARLEVDDLLAQLRGHMAGSIAAGGARAAARARDRDSMSAHSKLVHLVDGEPRIVSDPPLVEPIGELFGPADREALSGLLHELLRSYRESLRPDRRALVERFRLVDAARKVVGVGSVGTRDWILLLLGRDRQDALLLQLKEAQRSVLDRHDGSDAYANHGQRVVAGQHLMQASSDVFLGWLRGRDGAGRPDRDYYGRRLRNWKGAAEVESMKPVAMALYGQMCGWTLARAHARSGDAVGIAAYLGGGESFDNAIVEFGERYADQNQRDHAALVSAVADGRVRARPGV